MNPALKELSELLGERTLTEPSAIRRSETAETLPLTQEELEEIEETSE